MGNEITGANAIAGMKGAGTFGTAVTCVAGDGLTGWQITHGEGAEALQVAPIGSGVSMLSQSDRGNVKPSLSISGPLGYNSPEWVAIGQMMGTETVNTYVTGSVFCHSFLFNESGNQDYATVAFQGISAAAGAFEYPSCSTTKVALTFPEPAAYVTAAIDMLANEQKIASTTNTYATLNSVTAANLKKIVWESTDEFLINAQAGGALTSPTDRISIASATVEFNRPMEVAREANGTSGNGVPVATGDFPFSVTVQIKLRNLSDLTWFTAHKAGTEYKLSLTKTGPVISGAVTYKLGIHIPRCKIVVSPEWGLQNATSNPQTITFQAMVATANPTGMIDKKPYIYVQSDRATAHTA